MKYDWPSRNAATLAITFVAAYYSWRGFPSNLFKLCFATIILVIAIVFVFSEKNLRHRLAALIALQCVGIGLSFLAEFRCNPGSVCTVLSGIVLSVNVGVLCFLLWPIRTARIEV
jgi:hypothetical protein